MNNTLRKIFHPELHQGANKKPPFFEGWYYKIIDASETHKYAFIPGIFLHTDSRNQHAFVQVLNGTTGASDYHRFPFDEFRYKPDHFEIDIDQNGFSLERMRLRLGTGEKSIKGELRFRRLSPWPITVASPGVMGWYAYVPFMECFHGVLSFDHEIEGSLQVAGQSIDFTGGRGYMEKDWGKSFPSAHIWMQTNHFEQPGVSLSASVAIIPWLFSSFPGFIVGLMVNNVLYRFATYTGANIKLLDVTDNDIHWTMADKKHELEIHATRSQGGLLHAPTTTEMSNRLLESLTSTVSVCLKKKTGGIIFSGTGNHAGLELGGDLPSLLDLWRRSTKGT
jgi:tocopherol cyclase